MQAVAPAEVIALDDSIDNYRSKEQLLEHYRAKWREATRLVKFYEQMAERLKDEMEEMEVPRTFKDLRDDTNTIDALSILIAEYQALMGTNSMTVQAIELMAAKIVADPRYSFLTLAHVADALDRGLRGEYSDEPYARFNAQVIYHWLKVYRQRNHRNRQYRADQRIKLANARAKTTHKGEHLYQAAIADGIKKAAAHLSTKGDDDAKNNG